MTKYIDSVLEKDLYDKLRLWLNDLKFHEGQTNKGKEIDRKQLWFHREGVYFNPLWKERYTRWESQKFDPILDEVIKVIGNFINVEKINSCLINYYENGKSFIPFHVDNISSFGPEPTIINLSIGAERVLQIQDIETTNHTLKDNSIFVMSGPSVLHQLLPDFECNSKRWSLTFRQHLF